MPVTKVLVHGDPDNTFHELTNPGQVTALDNIYRSNAPDKVTQFANVLRGARAGGNLPAVPPAVGDDFYAIDVTGHVVVAQFGLKIIGTQPLAAFQVG